ncbi:MAG: RAMP superfamily CRISPR-associated protein, partial [Cyanobacteriota bacterium]|nr:RAMP superfamily CRISPR-associated protein [Cyanobacteriota bacterium]
MYTNPLLVELLEKQHQARGQTDLFKKGIFTLQWRAKVGSFPHPDIETLVSAGEPCGSWKPSESRPEDKRNVGQNLEQLFELPLNGYIPGSSIRGLVRAWAEQRPEIKLRMRQLLGYQDRDNDQISPGKIEFLDAWPNQPTKLTLDIVNPQQKFQVYHE